MSKTKPFVLGSLAGAALVYASLQYHLVRSDDGFYLVERTPQASLGLAYADVRGMSDEDVAKLPELARAINAHSLKELVADDGPEAKPPTTDPMFNEARERLRSTTGDWTGSGVDAVPRPPESDLDAPIWNPFTADRGAAGTRIDPAEPDDSLGTASADDPDDDNWPFGDESPFDEVTDELDEARDSFVTRTKDLTEQFDQPWTDTEQPSYGVKPFDYTADPRPRQTNRPVSPPADREQLRRDDNGNALGRNALHRRAREIYERSRGRSTQGLDSLINRSQSRASSVIDELVSPREGESAIDRAAQYRQPQRYRRDN